MEYQHPIAQFGSDKGQARMLTLRKEPTARGDNHHAAVILQAHALNEGPRGLVPTASLDGIVDQTRHTNLSLFHALIHAANFTLDYPAVLRPHTSSWLLSRFY
jgi:hypothetical protein